MERRCDACGEPYEAKRSTSKFCSARCRVRAHNGSTAASNVTPLKGSSGPSGPSSVVSATLARLEAAERLDSPEGAAALALAAKIDGGLDMGAGMASLVRELRATLAEALKDAPRAADGLDELRARREAKRHTG